MNNTNQYLMLISGNDWYNHTTGEELQAVIAKFGAWFEELNNRGVAGGAAPLTREGATITSKGGRITVADGPYPESKEAIGGYFILNVETLEEAVAIAKTCPGLAYSSSIEVRPIAAECPMMARAREFAEAATAGV